MKMKKQKTVSHGVDYRKLIIRIVALLCAVMILGSAFAAAFFS
jgi:hypothetical protein